MTPEIARDEIAKALIAGIRSRTMWASVSVEIDDCTVRPIVTVRLRMDDEWVFFEALDQRRALDGVYVSELITYFWAQIRPLLT